MLHDVTPKHYPKSLTLHQATRKKMKIVHLFHNAGHIMSYNKCLAGDTALPEDSLESLDNKTGAEVSPNLAPRRPIHYWFRYWYR